MELVSFSFFFLKKKKATKKISGKKLIGKKTLRLKEKEMELAKKKRITIKFLATSIRFLWEVGRNFLVRFFFFFFSSITIIFFWYFP